MKVLERDKMSERSKSIELDSIENKKLINKAKDLAFFAEQPLTQEILENSDKLKLYIAENEEILVKRKVISSNKSTPELSKESLIARRRWLRFLEFKSVYLASLFFIIITMLALSDSNYLIKDFVIQKIQMLIPSSQAWVNISPIYRESMSIVYLAFYSVLSVIIFLSIRNVLVNKNMFFGDGFIPLKNKSCEKRGLLIIVLIMLLILVSIIFFSPLISGSENFLSASELDNSSRRYIFRDEFMWNNYYGILFHKSLYLIFIGNSILLCAHILGNLKWCSKYK